MYLGEAARVDVGQVYRVTGEVAEFIPGGADSNNLSTTQITTSEDGIYACAIAADISETVLGKGKHRAPARFFYNRKGDDCS